MSTLVGNKFKRIPYALIVADSATELENNLTKAIEYIADENNKDLYPYEQGQRHEHVLKEEQQFMYYYMLPTLSIPVELTKKEYIDLDKYPDSIAVIYEQVIYDE